MGLWETGQGQDCCGDVTQSVVGQLRREDTKTCKTQMHDMGDARQEGGKTRVREASPQQKRPALIGWNRAGVGEYKPTPALALQSGR